MKPSKFSFVQRTCFFLPTYEDCDTIKSDVGCSTHCAFFCAEGHCKAIDFETETNTFLNTIWVLQEYVLGPPDLEWFLWAECSVSGTASRCQHSHSKLGGTRSEKSPFGACEVLVQSTPAIRGSIYLPFAALWCVHILKGLSHLSTYVIFTVSIQLIRGCLLFCYCASKLHQHLNFLLLHKSPVHIALVSFSFNLLTGAVPTKSLFFDQSVVTAVTSSVRTNFDLAKG